MTIKDKDKIIFLLESFKTALEMQDGRVVLNKFDQDWIDEIRNLIKKMEIR